MTEPKYYLDSRAGIVKYWITTERAQEIHEEHKGEKHFSGNLETGFEYWVPGPEGSGIEQLMHISVMPLPDVLVPESVRQELAGGALNVLAP